VFMEWLIGDARSRRKKLKVATLGSRKSELVGLRANPYSNILIHSVYTEYIWQRVE
jgi:hypothetical protein